MIKLNLYEEYLMKKLVNIILVFICSIIILFSSAFIFIEGRLLLSLDWLIYDSLNGLIRYLFRFILAIIALTTAILEIINLKKNTIFKPYLIYLNIGLYIMGNIIFLFTTNYVDILCFSVTSLLLIIKILKKKFKY